jgi:serine/threonine-protein kinase
MGLKTGEIAGDYRILGPVGSGGMGEVFRAQHTITRRVEAIKVLCAGSAGSQEQEQRFLREVQLQASLSHPNIAAVYNAFRLGDDLLLVMELVEGESLCSILGRERIPLSMALDYASQALGAIAYAHGHGVIHRDISPSNIIITSQGRLKLTDFGLAKAPAMPSLSRSGAPLGSPCYMSPEQVRNSAEVDARTDIYSMGAVLYEMVTGRKVFDGRDAFSIMQAQVANAPVPLVDVEPKTPPELNMVILTALEKDPERRFPTAGTFRAALQHVLHGPVPEPVWRRRSAGRNAAAVVMAMAAGVLTPVWYLKHYRPIPPVKALVHAPPPPAVVQVAPPVQPEAPPVSAPEPPPQPLAPVPKTASRPRKPLSAAVHDLTPRVVGEAEPVPVRPATVETGPAQEPLAIRATQETAAERGETAEHHAEVPDPPAAAPPDTPPSERAAADKEKKPRNRVWRALGRILK